MVVFERGSGLKNCQNSKREWTENYDFEAKKIVHFELLFRKFEVARARLGFTLAESEERIEKLVD